MEKQQQKAKTQDSELEGVLKAHQTNIKVVGAGGAGNNTLTRLAEVGVAGIETIAINTDAQDLLHTTAEHKLLIGRTITNGLGAGSNPQIGEESAQESQDDLKEFLTDSDMVFITCGLGGGTGSGSAPVVAEVAKSMGALTIAVITLPFAEEGSLRMQNAKQGLEQLRSNADTVIVVQNDRLLDIVPDLPLNAAFKVADEILVNAVKGITELVTEKGLVNLDFADVKAIMQDGDTAMIGIGESNSDDKAIDAVEKAVQNPLLDVDISGAKSALVNISGDANMSIREARSVMNAVAERLDTNARIIWGARVDEELEGVMRVLIIATGLKTGKKSQKDVTVTQSKKNKSKESDTEKVKKEPKHHIEQEQPVLEQPLLQPEIAARPVEPEKKSDLFDIQDKPAIDIMEDMTDKDTPKIKEAPIEQPSSSDKKTKKVFTEIFEEEIQGDLNILKRTVSELKSPVDQNNLRNIMNACTSIQSSAQLFNYDQIEEFTAFISGIIEDLLSGDAEFSEKLVVMLKRIPDLIERVVKNDDGDMPGYIEELTTVIEESNNDHHDDVQSNIAHDELIVDQEDLKNKLKMELN